MVASAGVKSVTQGLQLGATGRLEPLLASLSEICRMQRQRINNAYHQAATGSSSSSAAAAGAAEGGPGLQLPHQQLGRCLALLLPGAAPVEVAELVAWVEGGVARSSSWSSAEEVLEALQAALAAREWVGW